ncbi:MAG: hypothetical protein WCD07_09570, partial [Burkholderiales bacterium]
AYLSNPAVAKVVCFIVVPPSYPIIQILHLFDWMRGLNQSFPNQFVQNLLKQRVSSTTGEQVQ